MISGSRASLPRPGPLTRLLVASGLVIASADRSTAQDVAGVVIRSDSTPVAGVFVQLHRITESAGSVSDSTRTDEAGGFAFRPTEESDPSVVFLPSARHDGILYWGSPVHGGSVETDPEVQYLTVYDTVAVSEPIPDQVVAMRHVVITPTGSGLQVEEVLDLPGRGDRTLVTVEDGPPLWSGNLSADAHGVLPAAGGVSPEALDLSNETVAYTGVLPPSGVRLAVSYFVPSHTYVLELGHLTRRMDVLVTDVTGLEVDAAGITEVPSGEAVTVPVRRFAGSDLSPGYRVELRASIDEPGRTVAWVWFAIALLLAMGALVSVRVNRRA